jgi:hypothetical protein
VGGAGQDNMPVLNPTTTLEPVTTVSGVIYNNFAQVPPAIGSYIWLLDVLASHLQSHVCIQ